MDQEVTLSQSDTPDQLEQEVIVIVTDTESDNDQEEEEEEEEEQVECFFFSIRFSGHLLVVMICGWVPNPCSQCVQSF